MMLTRKNKNSYTVNLVKMIGPMEKKPSVRIAGYLEKKGKIRMVVSRWKRWWFVLEGRLLLYYQSQLEYLNLSPCRGSLNMGLAAGVRPGKALQLIVTTRSQTVILRASNCVEHEHWLQSLVDAMALPNSISTFNSRPVMHFRYRDNYHDNIIENKNSFKCPSYGAIFDDNGLTSGRSDSYKTCLSSHGSSVGLGANQPERSVLRRVLSDSRTLLRRPCKRDSTRNSSRLSKIAFSDTSIPASSQVNNLSQAHSSEKCQSMQELRNNISEDQLQKERMSSDPVMDEKVITGSKESKMSGSIKIELNLEEVESKTSENLKEQKIGNVKIVLDGCTIYECTKNNPVEDLSRINSKQLKGSSVNKHIDYTDPKRLNIQLYTNKESKSDSDLVSIRQQIRIQSVSCENMETLDRSIGSTYNDKSAKIEVAVEEDRGKLKPSQSVSSQGCLGRKPNKKRSHSILSRFRDSKSDTDDGNFERGGTIRKRLSFLRKMWKKRENKTEEEDSDSNEYESIPVVIELPSPEIIEKPEVILKSFDKVDDCSPEPEPPPDYDTSLTEVVDTPPTLPPRQQKERPVSPWHDIPRNNQPVELMEEDTPPPLPLKKKHNTSISQVSIKQAKDPSEEQMSNSLEDDSITCEPPSIHGDQQLEDLDTLLAKLTEVNTYVVRQIDISQNFNGNIVQVSAAIESDYDVPRPHVSLVATLRSQNTRSETFTPTHFLCTTPLVDVDSLDPVANRLESEITPDSLECDSQWSLVPATTDSHSPHSGSMLHHFITTEEKFFPDSLNT